ncbi:uncharacterized protein HD556DRAFT_1393737 [Suillus plorans]|uniref:DNA replication regulator Sld3 C-terminal domain-containing protein n=1 Tax=Suillus plorans TaxID=116603 RepID=A0A9P7DF98_9AGAM|nr:uncharacterized protein HD556DRAFT_1393737 [Suillus plorans]KAG1790244.1 hypothetical protein HD556DRAFT_1393737 [Suillus plorans]
MSLQQAFVLHTPASFKWTAAQEKSLSRDYPFQDHDPTDPALFVQRTYLHFLWLPHSIMPLSLFIPSLLRIRGTPNLAEDQPHPLHAFIEPLLLSLRAAANKYHNELPQILADGGGACEAEESMMWYALGYEKVDGSAERGEHLTGEDSAMLEEKWRSGWLERMEQREVQIQILLYFLKLSLPGPCTPLPPVEVPPTNNISFVSPVKPNRSRKKKKEKPNLIIPSSIERLESFMDKLSMWQLVSLMNISRSEIMSHNKNGRDWMQKFCEDVVGPLFKSKLPEQCALLRSKLFPNSPFSDEPPSPGPSTEKSLHGSRSHHSSSAATGSQSGVATRAPARTRSLSVSLAQEKEKERAASVGTTQDKALQRALTRQISMSRTWKGKDRSTAMVSQADIKMPAATAKRIIGRTDSQSQSRAAITLVTATPVKKPPPRAKSNASARSSSPIPIARSSSVLTTGRSSSPHLTGRSSSPPIARSSSHMPLDTDDNELPGASVLLLDFSSDSLGNVMEEDEDAEGETWLPNSSPDVLLLGKSGWGISAKKRVPSAVLDSNTPVRKRMKLGK